MEILFQTAILTVITIFIALIPLSISILFFFGPPYVPTPKHIVKEMLDLVKVGKGDLVVDLGSGDGVVLIEAAKLGAIGKGWEINPFLVLLTKIRARIRGLQKKVFVFSKPYQKANLKDASVIFCYNLPKFMPEIEKKLKKELKSGTKIVAYKFPLSGFKLIKKTKSGIFLYKLK